MVSRCCVIGCKSSWLPGRSIKFHRFPTNTILRNKWLAAVKLKTTLYRHAKICSLHFKSTDYDSTGNRLNNTAIPFFNEASISGASKSKASKSNSVVRQYRILPAPCQDEIITSYLEVPDCSSNNGDLKQEDDDSTHSDHHQEEMIIPDSEITDCSSDDVTDLNQEHNYASHSDHHREGIITPESVITDCSSNNVTESKQYIPCGFNQYYVVNLKQTASANTAPLDFPSSLNKNVQANLKSPREVFLQKKKKVLEQKVGRLSKQLKSMSTLIASIKTYFSQSEVENIISGNFADIQRKLFKKKKIQSPHGMRFSDDVKNFALNVHFYSPQVYNYLKQYLSLPSPSTLYKPQKASDSELERLEQND